MIVVDASAVVDFVSDKPPEHSLAERILEARSLHAPHLVDVEVSQALRRLVMVGELSSDRAFEARADAALLPITRYPHLPLLERAWELRDNTTLYDGVYLALAEFLDAPLVTCDRRLAGVPGHTAVIEVY